MKLAEKVSGIILDRIATGYYSIGQLMPAETEIAEDLGVSRLTLRESIKDLAARGVLQVRHGKRNKIAPPEQWSVIDPQLAHIRAELTGNTTWITQLMEARHILEVGACELAASRITPKQLQQLATLIELMQKADSQQDVQAAVHADMDFHSTIFEAAGNDYLKAAYKPLEEVLKSVRYKTSSSPKVRADAAHWHSKIYEALAAGSPTAASHAMRQHMEQTVGAVHEVTHHDSKTPTSSKPR